MGAGTTTQKACTLPSTPPSANDVHEEGMELAGEVLQNRSVMEFKVYGLEFRVYGLGFRV